MLLYTAATQQQKESVEGWWNMETTQRRMPRTIWYMGVKSRVLPGFLDEVLEREIPRGGTVVDLMCGSGAVAFHCARRWRVFANDAQEYSRVIASSLLEHDPATKEGFLASLDPQEDVLPNTARHFEELATYYAPALDREAELLRRFSESPDAQWAREYRLFLENPHGVYPASEPGAKDALYARAQSLLAESRNEEYRSEPRRRPACLMTTYYSNIYFGLRQAIMLDALRAAIQDIAGDAGVSEKKRTHYLSALLHVASISTSSTSHFAQPRHLRKDSELKAMARRRQRDIRELFLDFSADLKRRVAEVEHREGNRAFARDYREFLKSRRDAEEAFEFPAGVDLIYLDPPYTADNYSRFYHALEALASYDYPTLASGADGVPLRGRYPEIRHRFQSGFCRPATVESEFRRVAAASARAGAKLVISYASPSGLLLKHYARQGEADPVARFEAVCRESFRDVRTERRRLMHSGQGDSNKTIDELLLICREPSSR